MRTIDRVDPCQAEASAPPVHTRAVIIGTGFAGLGMAIALQRRGVDFVILEKADDIGGTWRDNSYPGCACDVPSHLYSFSFEPKATWSKLFSPQPEILDYLKGVTEKYGLRRYIRFGAKVSRAHWDDERIPLARLHRVRRRVRRPVSDLGRRRAAHPAHTRHRGHGRIPRPRFPFRAVGPQRRFDRQAGRDHRHRGQCYSDRAGAGAPRRRGRRGAALSAHSAVGGAAAEQPAARMRCASLRAMCPGLRLRCDRESTGGSRVSGYAMTQRPEPVARCRVGRQVEHPPQCPRQELRRRLTPNYRAGCKRILYSGNYYQAVANPKSTLITDRISRITADGIVTDDGVEHQADVIVYATGFHTTDSYTYVDVKGPRGEDLVDRWNREGVVAHRGIAVADMPNLFFLLGPNTGLGHTSVVFMIESQIHYVAEAIAAVDKAGAQALAPSRSAQDRTNAELQTQAGRLGVEHRRLQQLVPRRARRQPDAVERNDLAVLAGHPLAQARRIQVLRRGHRISRADERLTDVQAAQQADEHIRGSVHAGVVVGGHEIQQQAADDGHPEPCEGPVDRVHRRRPRLHRASRSPRRGPCGRTASRPATRGRSTRRRAVRLVAVRGD